MNAITFTPIGIVKNDVTELKHHEWGEDTSVIVLEPQYAAGLEGLEQYSHAVILYHLHETPPFTAEKLVRHPRERADLPLVGIFAQRGKHRPNPIGITAVEIIKAEPGRLVVCGLDAVNGSPVLDIKPYAKSFDCRPAATEPAWLTTMLEDYF